MRVHVCGSRGSAPAPGAEHVRFGGDTSCVAISGAGDAPDLLIDAGTGVRGVDARLGDAAFRGSILLGHLHWDHIQGIPFFASGDRAGSRVEVFVPRQKLEPEEAIGRMMSPPTFPITPGELLGEWHFLPLDEGQHRIGRYQVTAAEIPHKGGRTFGYRISNGSGSIAYLSDHHPSSMGPGVDGHGVIHDAALGLALGVDLLIHDAQFLGNDWPRRMPFGHSTPTYAVRLGREAGAKTVLLFHHDPRRTDEDLDELATEFATEEEPQVLVASQGLVLDVGEN